MASSGSLLCSLSSTKLSCFDLLSVNSGCRKHDLPLKRMGAQAKALSVPSSAASQSTLWELA